MNAQYYSDFDPPSFYKAESAPVYEGADSGIILNGTCSSAHV